MKEGVVLALVFFVCVVQGVMIVCSVLFSFIRVGTI